MNKQAYNQGFIDKCAEYGITKSAIPWGKLLGAGVGAAALYGGGKFLKNSVGQVRNATASRDKQMSELRQGMVPNASIYGTSPTNQVEQGGNFLGFRRQNVKLPY